MYKSQKLARVAPEIRALRLGMGWNPEDLEKPQVLIESTAGMSHPGSVHLDRVVQAVEEGVRAHGGQPSHFTVTDICDGIAQGHEGMNYSLASREFICGMIEIHAQATPFDGLVLVSSCDKAIPAHLMSAARLGIPAVHVPGGTMLAGPDFLTLEQIGTYNVKLEQGEITSADFRRYELNACPSCGACQFMGTACTMQVMAEALGLALPGSALIPAAQNGILRIARAAGRAVVELIQRGITARDILTPAAFRNAIRVHAAIAGSTNALLHLPAIAHELGITLAPELFDKINREVPWLVDAKPSGRYPAEFVRYAGGVPAIMREIKELLELDALTVTGKTVGENLEELELSGYFELAEFELRRYGLHQADLIRPRSRPLRPDGGIAVLSGNLAPLGAVVKQAAINFHMLCHTGPAVPFNSEEEAYQAIVEKRIKPGSVIIIRYEGPRGSGMPEMFYTTEALAADRELVNTTALVTDGRFSGASRGPAVGHVSPEAISGGPLALIEPGDLIRIDIPGRRLDIVGVAGEEKKPADMERILAARRATWQPPTLPEKKGVLKIYCRSAASAMEGGYME
ncbi:dihydroxy-acid dehydratase [Neomoorella thermoacetica]|uniref:dihydroxy-acid dehydratase n=1 Tax=Neomoorella thermoacetica TaxID=1525 RepID=UPI000471DF97|nr:dihydroxy-acid dehydratase [Moorella thermoacetica]